MKSALSICVAYLAHHAWAHESHGPNKGETIQQYAQRHMSSEHHIDTFDTRSFFQLHDLNRDGVWDKEEIQAVYGVHHVYSTRKSKDDEEHQKKADQIVETVLKAIDVDKDGKITPEELERVGLDGLPNFDHMGAEGHHYDVESEFFLHHEEEFHSTPETQTDESYNHAEDYEHFRHHERIERKEAEKEAQFEGISVDEVLREQRRAEELAAAKAVEAKELARKLAMESHAADETTGNPRPTRVPAPEDLSPEEKFSNVEGKEDWGSGEDGYMAPADPADRLRKNLPYKERMQYKFRRSWGDF